MRPEENITDLEYLADRGFEKAAVSEKDIAELQAKVRSRSVSYNSGNYFAFISLIMGVFIGISVFFNFYTPPLSRIPFSPETNKTVAENNEKAAGPATVTLDTINFEAENFVKRVAVKNDQTVDTFNVAGHIRETDTAASLASLPINPADLKPEKIKEPDIKYLPNAPIVFIYDLKLTDYSTLYFKRNKFVNLTVKEGIGANYANKEDLKRYGNVLEPADAYYLHQAIGEAMLQFKNKRYNVCLATLNTVAQFTGNDINCRFYSGMCYFYKNNYTDAIKNFDECISSQNNSFVQEAEYYKAICLFESGNKTEALTLFKKMADDGGFYAEKAKKYL